MLARMQRNWNPWTLLEQLLWKTVQQFFKKSTRWPCDPAIPLCVYIQKKWNVYMHTRIHSSIIHNSQKKKQPQCETIQDEWISQMLSIHTVEMVGWHHRLDGHEFEQAPGDREGQGSLACCSPWGRKESGTTERLNTNKQQNNGTLLFSLNRMETLTHLRCEWTVRTSR